MDIEASDLIVGLLMTAMGLIGLLLASGAHDIEMYVFGLMRRHFDRADAALAATRARGGRHE